MAVCAQCPAYITGIFTIGENDAAGAGFAIDKMLKTTLVRLRQGRSRILINGTESPAPVSRAVLRRYTSVCGGIGLVEIRHETQIPIGYGLGQSAAGALSLSLALNEYLGCGFSHSRCVKIAHDAEVECGTGLSGVDAAAVGGFLAKKKIGQKPLRLELEEREIHVAFFSPIRTASIVHSEEWKEKVNEAGERALAMFFAKKSWDGFLEASRYFTVESGLGNWAAQELEANPKGSMAMLGQTIFSPQPLRLSRTPVALVKARTYGKGAEVL
ncbi:MAG: hypothetical protein N3E51_01715 [Candidatus Micrarchaeota archaeon]|nr:hypothetical protein [Candidatus Micrarchaeota archaeon]